MSSTLRPISLAAAPPAAPSKPAAAPATVPRDRVELGARRDLQVNGGRSDGPPAPPSFDPQPGSASIGDPYYPALGNGGYHAKHYAIDLAVDMVGNRIQGSTTVDAQATQDLSAFNLDLNGFDVGAVTVNGQPATVARQDGELTITPAAPLHQGEHFQVAVSYGGVPQPVTSQAVPMVVGWKSFGNGVCVDCEPDGASHWIPVNDHPRDKASYSFHIDVPEGWVVAANGMPKDPVTHDGRTTFHFDAKDPMASYLATVQIGHYTPQSDVSPNGVPILNYFPVDVADDAKKDFARCGQMIDYFAGLVGPYPFERYGNFVVDTGGEIGGALECQTMSIFDNFVVTGHGRWENVIAHELFHQWFGDFVSVKNWKDIFLNEGFASYGEWLWTEKTQGKAAADAQAHDVYNWMRSSISQTTEKPKAVTDMLMSGRHSLEKSQPRSGGIEIGQPPADDLFDEKVYLKGALALYALRQQVGDDSFFKGLQGYVAQYGGKNAEIADFINLMQTASGQDLKTWADGWLYSDGVPDLQFPTGK